ncbi:MAG: response regulator [Phycisphaerales bacterium]|nr:response regulator [Phycisphaerae bacterium]NNF43184.1 response regulator [Phycisphaerales bacterium]NNM24567.1 response regulator [Phycisphaerales bacterium]
MNTTQRTLEGRRILLAEDALAIAEEMATALGDAGVDVIGPFPRLDRLIEAIETPGFSADAALLDVDLRGVDVFPAAKRLKALGVPFILTTGFAAEHIPPDFRDEPRLEKPVDLNVLMKELCQLLGLPPDASPPAAS